MWGRVIRQMSGKKALIRSVVFLLVLGVSIYLLQGLFAYDDEYTFENQTGMMHEKRERLDGVYIGASNVYYYWQPLFGWMDHGIAIRNFCGNSLRPAALKYYVMEAEKRQPNALFIININTFKYYDNLNLDAKNIHRAVDYMPLSMNTLRLTHDLTERSSYKGLERLEFYLPIIRFHSRWDSLSPWTLGASDVDYKSSLHAANFLEGKKDITKKYRLYDTEEPFSEDMQRALEDLLDYFDAHKLKVLFVKVPQALIKKRQSYMKTAQKIIEARGYPILDLYDKFSEMEIDMRQECWNERHTNLHGSVKFSWTLGNYLVEHYQFQDKRGLPEWADWDRSAKQYAKLVDQYLLPFETAHAARTFTDIPVLRKPKVDGQSVTLTWEDTGNVSGYLIYRKRKAGKDLTWHEVAQVDAVCRQWVDEGLSPRTSYSYRVVPFISANGERTYGSFDIGDVSARTAA